MSDSRGPVRSAAGYARTITEWWSDATGRPHVLSPREWHLVNDWYERRVPLAVVREAIESLREKARRRGGEPRRFYRLVQLVDESWETLVDGRVTEDGPSAAVSQGEGSGADRWRLRRDAEPAGSALRSLLSRLLDELDAGAEPQELEARLDDEIEAAVERGVVAELSAEVERELEPYRARLPRDTLRATQRRALVSRLRGRLGLPALD